MEYLLRLCEILRCTPNDLFDFNLEKNKFIDEDHPLHELKKQPIPVNINEYFKNASFSDIEELQNFVIQQKQKKGNSNK